MALDTRDIGHREIVEIFGSSGDPSPHVYGDRGRKHILVSSVLTAGRSRYPDVADLEAKLDEFVRSVGGERIETVDPWRALGNFGRRLIRRPPQPPDDLYALPNDVLSGAS